ncbi:MAG: cytoplasmic protein [Pseudomonadota bacterium]
MAFMLAKAITTSEDAIPSDGTDETRGCPSDDARTFENENENENGEEGRANRESAIVGDPGVATTPPSGRDYESSQTAFRQTFLESVPLPADAFVIGEPIQVVAIGMDTARHPRLLAQCIRNGQAHDVGLVNVCFPIRSPGAVHVAAYRRWLGLDPEPACWRAVRACAARHKAAVNDVPLDRRCALVVLAVQGRGARCRVLGSEREISLRSRIPREVVPGYIVTVEPRKQWSYAGHPYLAATILDSRLDVAALQLTPLELLPRTTWDPRSWQHSKTLAALGSWAASFLGHGTRTELELERAFVGESVASCAAGEPTPKERSLDPFVQIGRLRRTGEQTKARRLLMDLVAQDLRSIQAHAMLGNQTLELELEPQDALRHYEVGARIGELSLEKDFNGILPWRWAGNRAFLACLRGLGICQWRLKRNNEAANTMLRLLAFDPDNGHDACLLLSHIQLGRPWTPYLPQARWPEDDGA